MDITKLLTSDNIKLYGKEIGLTDAEIDDIIEATKSGFAGKKASPLSLLRPDDAEMIKGLIDEIKPIMEMVIAEIVKIVEENKDTVAKLTVSQDKALLEAYMENGFSRDEAMDLVVVTKTNKKTVGDEALRKVNMSSLMGGMFK